MTAAAPTQNYNLFVAQTQLFQLLLNATGGPVQMTVLDANYNVIGSLTAATGMTVSGSVLLLKPGTYQVQFTSVGDGTTLPADALYSAYSTALIDPIGPIAGDPTTQPKFITPGNPGTYTYPTGTVTTQAYLWALLNL